MKKLLALGVLSLFIGMTATTLSGGKVENREIGDRFVGAWRLASLERRQLGVVHRHRTH
jgi:hypothetical protein